MEIKIPQELIDKAIRGEVEQQVKDYFRSFERDDVIEDYCIAYSEKEFNNLNQEKIDNAIESRVSTYIDGYMNSSEIYMNEIVKCAVIEKISKFSVYELIEMLKTKEEIK